MALKPWDRRATSTNKLQPIVQQEVAKIAGVRVVAFQPPPLPGSIGLPVQFVIGTTVDAVRAPVQHRAGFSARGAAERHVHLPRLAISRFDNPQSNISIDRDKTAQLGLKMSDVGGSLAAMLGGGYTNYFPA